MIVSVHLADLRRRAAARVLRGRPDPRRIPGLSYAETVLRAPLGGRLPLPQLGQVGLIAAWSDDQALDRFLSEHPLAEPLSGGWQVRLQPLRVSGSWTGLQELPQAELSVAAQEPVAVLTLGRLRLHRAPPFLRASGAAEAGAVASPALLAATGLTRPPSLVSTFSLWRSASAMRAYAYEHGGPHSAAIKADRRRAFHHESAFIRFRPYRSSGRWDGADPLADTSLVRPDAIP